MRHRLSYIGMRLMHRVPWMGSFSAPFLHERQGIDLTSMACETRMAWRQCLFAPPSARILVLAAPMRAFRMHVMPLEAKLSHRQLMQVLRERGLIQDDMAVDLLIAPDDHTSVAIFTLPMAQCDTWQSSYRSAATYIAAIEPDCHALWRYAKHQQATQHGWLVVMPHQSTLYWPTSWPWGYHAEPLIVSVADSNAEHHALHTALRRASLMTGNDAPGHVSLILAGDKERCLHWQAVAEDIHWHYSEGPHPVAAGASLKTQRRWA